MLNLQLQALPLPYHEGKKPSSKNQLQNLFYGDCGRKAGEKQIDTFFIIEYTFNAEKSDIFKKAGDHLGRWQ